jgi:flavin reductase (DIM6/NTAB) family NADH-FMN oxidoreductase RutF
MAEMQWNGRTDTVNKIAFDIGRYKQALAKFPTGVAVVTGKGLNGQAIGLTVNSFASVSLAPALVMWCLRKESSLYQDFLAATHFVVNVLAEDQGPLAAQFAARTADRFGGVACRTAAGGCVALTGVAATFECEVVSRQVVGDHLLLTGEVDMFDMFDHRPLILQSGQPDAGRKTLM